MIVQLTTEFVSVVELCPGKLSHLKRRLMAPLVRKKLSVPKPATRPLPPISVILKPKPTTSPDASQTQVSVFDSWPLIPEPEEVVMSLSSRNLRKHNLLNDELAMQSCRQAKRARIEGPEVEFSSPDDSEMRSPEDDGLPSQVKSEPIWTLFSPPSSSLDSLPAKIAPKFNGETDPNYISSIINGSLGNKNGGLLPGLAINKKLRKKRAKKKAIEERLIVKFGLDAKTSVTHPSKWTLKK